MSINEMYPPSARGRLESSDRAAILLGNEIMKEQYKRRMEQIAETAERNYINMRLAQEFAKRNNMVLGDIEVNGS